MKGKGRIAAWYVANLVFRIDKLPLNALFFTVTSRCVKKVARNPKRKGKGMQSLIWWFNSFPRLQFSTHQLKLEPLCLDD
jgi:hypothetical protein